MPVLEDSLVTYKTSTEEPIDIDIWLKSIIDSDAIPLLSSLNLRSAMDKNFRDVYISLYTQGYFNYFLIDKDTKLYSLSLQTYSSNTGSFSFLNNRIINIDLHIEDSTNNTVITVLGSLASITKY